MPIPQLFISPDKEQLDLSLLTEFQIYHNCAGHKKKKKTSSCKDKKLSEGKIKLFLLSWHVQLPYLLQLHQLLQLGKPFGPSSQTGNPTLLTKFKSCPHLAKQVLGSRRGEGKEDWN